MLNSIEVLQNRLRRSQVWHSKNKKRKNKTKQPVFDVASRRPDKLTVPSVDRVADKSLGDELSKSLSRDETDLPKLLVVGDDNVSGCVETLNKILNFRDNNYKISSFFKPGAFLDEVVKDVHKLCLDFNHNDRVIIFAGTNNCLKGRKLNSDSLYEALDLLSFTNVSLVGGAYCRDRRVFNDIIFEFNNNLHALALNFMHVEYFDINSYLAIANLTNSKPFINLYLKRTVFGYFCDFHLINVNLIQECC